MRWFMEIVFQKIQHHHPPMSYQVNIYSFAKKKMCRNWTFLHINSIFKNPHNPHQKLKMAATQQNLSAWSQHTFYNHLLFYQTTSNSNTQITVYSVYFPCQASSLWLVWLLFTTYNLSSSSSTHDLIAHFYFTTTTCVMALALAFPSSICWLYQTTAQTVLQLSETLHVKLLV